MYNNYDEIDNFLFDYFKNNQIVPTIISEGIDSALTNKKNKPTLSLVLKKIIIILTGLFTITGGVVFAKDISQFVHNFFNFNTGIDTAIQNGYLENPKNAITESNNIKIIIENFLMDDNNLNFTFYITSTTNKSLGEIKDISLKDFIITDENNNIIYSDNIELIKSFCNNNGIEFNSEKFNDSFSNSGVNNYIKNKRSNSFECIYNFTSLNYPKSKYLYINIKKIIFNNIETESINGEWSFALDVPEQFYNREMISYSIKSNNSNIELKKLQVTDTGTKLELFTKIENNNTSDMINFIKSYINIDDDFETKQNKIDELNMRINNPKDLKDLFEKYSHKNPFSDIYIINENNDKFYATSSNDTDTNYVYSSNGDINCFQTIDLTKKDATDNLIVHFKYLEKDIKIELEKE